MTDDSSSPPGEELKAIKTILIVEDDEDIGTMLVQALSQETHYQGLYVRDGFEALKVVQTLKPSLFVLDYQLPHMNGIELYDQLSAIKELNGTPTVMLSATFPPKKAMRERQITYLSKPFELGELLALIAKLLE